MTFWSLMFSMLFGTLGSAYIIYAKNAGRILPAVAGLLLLLIPWFLPGTLWMLIVCTPVTIMPFVLREI
jgi:hypothetical protein